MVYIGIDPGKRGGIAVVDADGKFLRCDPMPPNVVELVDVLQRTSGRDRFVMLERVNAAAVVGRGSGFTFGRGFGWIEGALTALHIPHTYTMPAEWQRRMGCLTGGDKNISKARAAEKFPRITVTHWNADALLIAQYGRLVYRTLARARQPRH